MSLFRKRSSARLPTSLRAQLMLTTVVPVTALLVALALVGMFAFTRLSQTLVEERDAELVQFAAQQVASHWADSVALLEQTASLDPVRAGDVAASEALLGQYDALRQRFDRINITNARGDIVAAVGTKIAENVEQLDYFERARRLRRPVRSVVYKDMDGQSVVVVAVPIFGNLGQFSGCILGIWDLRGSSMGLPVASVRVSKSSYAYVVDSEGIVLVHPDQGTLLAMYGRHPAVAALLQGLVGAQTISEEGVTTVIGYAPIPLRHLTGSLLADQSWGGWGLLTVELWADIVAPLRPYLVLMVLIMALAVVLPFTFLTLNTRQIIAPLQSLVGQSERIANEEFDIQVSVNAGPTEVRELEVAFNGMVQKLRKYRDDIQRYIVSILNSQEDERKRIARELHDETAQNLVVLGRQIEAAEDHAATPELTRDLESVRDMVDETLKGVRRFTSDLRPPLLEELGLPRTLDILGSRIEREGLLQVDVEIEGEPRLLLPELDLGLYRLAQESLSNVRRHANATRVRMRLIYRENEVELFISDDGVGFEAPSDLADLIKAGRLGLMGMHERARLFGGRATIVSKPGQGTEVRILVPLTAIVLPTVKLEEYPVNGGEE